MSSILVIRQANAIHMITDGASYTPDGILTRIGTKAIAVPSINAVVYARGPETIAQLVSYGIDRFLSFDDLVDGLEEFAADFYIRNSEIYSENTFKEAELFIAGWSEKRREPECYLIRLCPAESGWNERLPSWQVEAKGSYAAPANVKSKVSALCAAPSFSENDMRAACFPFPIPVESLDPKIDGLHLFEIQRRKLTVRPDQPEHYCIGGIALLSTIRRNEVTQTVLARYKDRIGETIQPEEIDWAEWRAKAEGRSVGALRSIIKNRRPHRGQQEKELIRRT